MPTVVEAPVIPGMESVIVDTSAYLEVHGGLPAGGFVQYEIGGNHHGYSPAFTYEQSLAWAKHDAARKGVQTIRMLP